MNPFEGDVSPARLAGMMRDPSRIAGFLTQEVPGVGASGAAIVADIINVQRADVKKLAEAHDVDVEIKRMSEERAAELVAGIVDGDAVELVEVFNELAEKRDKVLQEVLESREYQEFMSAKTEIMLTDDPDTFDAEPIDVDGGVIDDLEADDGGEAGAD